MPIGDFFKSTEQKKQEAQQAAKATKEGAELNLFKKKRQLENHIKLLERERLQLSKQYNQLPESSKEAASVLATFKTKTRDLENHKLALSRIGSIETQLRGSAAGGADALGEIVAEALREIDVLTTPEATGGMSEDEKLRIEMNLAKKLSEVPSSGGGIDLESLAGKVFTDEEEMSDEDALSDIKGLFVANQNKSDKDADAKIKAQLKDLDAKIKTLEPGSEE